MKEEILMLVLTPFPESLRKLPRPGTSSLGGVEEEEEELSRPGGALLFLAACPFPSPMMNQSMTHFFTYYVRVVYLFIFF